jgi:hypothetical protein
MSRAARLKSAAASLSAGFYLPAAGRSGNGRRTPNPRATSMTLERPMFPPRDSSRRGFLTVAAGGAVAAVAGSPTAALAAAPASDPIYVVIERHIHAVAIYDAAVRVRGGFNDAEMDGEQRAQLAVLKDAVNETYDRMEDAGTDLVNTKPTTLAGIVVLCRYIEPLLDEDETPHLPQAIYWDDDTASTVGGALANVIAAAVDALIKAQTGKGVLA